MPHTLEGVPRIPRRLSAILLALLLAACGGGSSAPPLEAAASVAAAEEATNSLGFVVERHGWTFGNYAASGSGLFGVADAVALFGDSAVCVEAQGECTPTPAAAEWIDMVATSMQYGVCEGMTVASVDRFLVGADPVTGLVALDDTVERQLARLFATQFLEDVIKATEQWREQSVADIVAELQASLADPTAEQYTLGVYSPMGGHSVLPYAVDVDGSGRGVVYVYDPNWPGEQRYIEVDTAANSWRFSYFSPDQGDDPEAWTGGNGMMDLTPLSVREAPFPEPFKGSGTGVKQLLAVSSSTRNWILTRGDGSQVDGQSVMPGRDGVVAVTRGAPLDTGGDSADAVLVEWTKSARLEVQSGAATLSLFTDAGAGSVVVSDEASIKVEVPDDPERVEEVSLVIEVEVAEDTEAVVTVASATDRVRVEADAEVTTTVRLAEESTAVEVVDKSGEQLMAVEIPRSEERVDIAVDVKGDIEVFEPETISAEERIEAVEKSTKLLVADDVEARTVEVTAALVDKVDETKLRVLSVAEAEKTFTTTVLDKIAIDSRERSEGSEKTTDTVERITEDEVATIEVDESTQSATLLLSDGSKIELRMSEDGELVTSDGRTLEVELEPEKQKELERLDPKQVEADQTLKDIASSDLKLEGTDDSTKTTDPSTGTQRDREALEDTADKKPEFSDDSALDDTGSKDATPKSERNEKDEPSTKLDPSKQATESAPRVEPKPEPSTELDSSKQETESAPRIEPKPEPSTEKRAPSFESDSTRR
jgi:hypothetical protein